MRTQIDQIRTDLDVILPLPSPGTDPAPGPAEQDAWDMPKS